MKKKFLKLRKFVDFPPEFSKKYYMEIYSEEKAVLTGFGEIITYEDSVLKIKFGEKEIIFSGKNLDIKNYSSEGFEISGKIENIEFPKRGDFN